MAQQARRKSNFGNAGAKWRIVAWWIWRRWSIVRLGASACCFKEAKTCVDGRWGDDSFPGIVTFNARCVCWFSASLFCDTLSFVAAACGTVFVLHLNKTGRRAVGWTFNRIGCVLARHAFVLCWGADHPLCWLFVLHSLKVKWPQTHLFQTWLWVNEARILNTKDGLSPSTAQMHAAPIHSATHYIQHTHTHTHSRAHSFAHRARTPCADFLFLLAHVCLHCMSRPDIYVVVCCGDVSTAGAQLTRVLRENVYLCMWPCMCIIIIYIYIYVSVLCMCMCDHVCMYACMCVWCVCVCVYVYVYVYVYEYVCMCICVCVYVYVFMSMCGV